MIRLLRKLLLLFVVILLSGPLYAQNGTYEEFLLGGPEDGTKLMNYYFEPLLKGMGYGFNNAWYNTAKPHKTGGFDITFAANFAFVPESEQTFVFDPAEYNFTSLAGSSTNILPTIAGGKTDAILQVTEPITGTNQVVATYPAPDGLGEQTPLFKYSVPSPIIQAGVGLIKGTEIKLRWMPAYNQDGFSVKYFGVGGLHSISQWFMAFKDRPVDISAFFGYTNINAVYAIPPGYIAGSNQKTEFTVNTFTFQVLASAHVSVLTGYVGIGLDSFYTNLGVRGTYIIYEGDPILGDIIIDEDLDVESRGNNEFRATVGARLKLAILVLFADYTFREYNTVTMGLGFSFR